MLMHLQQAVEGYDVFARSLSIGPETMVMRFRPELPMHERYAVDHDFLPAAAGEEVRHHRPAGQRVLPLGVQLLRDAGRAAAGCYPIDYANACPDIAMTSLHYYFPWAMARAAALERLLRW